MLGHTRASRQSNQPQSINMIRPALLLHWLAGRALRSPCVKYSASAAALYGRGVRETSAQSKGKHPNKLGPGSRGKKILGAIE